MSKCAKRAIAFCAIFFTSIIAHAGGITVAIFDGTQGQRPLRGASLVLSCGDYRQPVKTDNRGEFTAYTSQVGRCTLRLVSAPNAANFRGPVAINLASYGDPIRYDLVLINGRLRR